MTLELLEFLLSPSGQAALATAARQGTTERDSLRALADLRKHWPAAEAAAVVETVLLRNRARVKYRHAERMYFTREALEMASGECIAAYRAERFAGFARVADLGCGIGGDTLALAQRTVVSALDLDPVRARITHANAAACGLADRVLVKCADLFVESFADVQAVFADPGRRHAGQRFLSLQQYQPPPEQILQTLPKGLPVAFKLAPGVDRQEVLPFDGELEFISVNGELKEGVLWMGQLRTSARRATLLLQNASDKPVCHTFAADSVVWPATPGPVQSYLYEPTPALVRAELEGNQAAEWGLHPIDSGLAMFSGNNLASSPFWTRYRVEAVLPLDSKRIQSQLNTSQVGRVTVVQCGSSADAEAIRKKCKTRDGEHRFLLLSRELGRSVAVLAERC